jgi:hypothetical protein
VHFKTVLMVVPEAASNSPRASKSKHPRPFSGVQSDSVCVLREGPASSFSLLPVAPLRITKWEINDLCIAYKDGFTHPSDPSPAARRTELIFDKKPAIVSAGGGA